jgi:hypothetical protein
MTGMTIVEQLAVYAQEIMNLKAEVERLTAWGLSECRRASTAEDKLAKVVERIEHALAETVSRMDEYVTAGRISKADALHEVVETMRQALAAAKEE